MKYSAEQQIDNMVRGVKNAQPDEAAVEHSQASLMKRIAEQEVEQGCVGESSKNTLRNLLSRASLWLKESLVATPMRAAGSMSMAATFAFAMFMFTASTQVSFASMVNELKNIQSMFYTASMKTGGQPLMDMKVYYRANGQLRVENYSLGKTDQPTFINIMDIKKGQGAIIQPQHGMVTPFEFQPNAEPEKVQEDPLFWRDLILQVDPESAQNLGTKNIGGQKLTGYLIEHDGIETKVWIDHASELPVELEVAQYQDNGQVGFEMKAEVIYNQTFSDELFNIDRAQ